MLKLLVASLATASALKVKSQPAVKPLSNALKLRGGVSAADVAHYGQLFLCASVGVPALVGGSDLLFKINYPGFDWDGYTSKWTPESKNYLNSMTRFFAGSLLVVGGFAADYNEVTRFIQVFDLETRRWRGTGHPLPPGVAETHQGVAVDQEASELYLVVLTSDQRRNMTRSVTRSDTTTSFQCRQPSMVRRPAIARPPLTRPPARRSASSAIGSLTRRARRRAQRCTIISSRRSPSSGTASATSRT